MTLRLTVPFHDDETVASLTSRLARRNGSDARSFCRHFNVSFQAVADGKKSAIHKIAGLAGLDAPRLLANAIVRSTSGNGATYRGETLSGPTVRRSPAAFCPICALDDVKRNPSMDMHCAIYGRALWLISAIRTCPIHAIELAFARHDERARSDFTQQIRSSVNDLAGLEKAAVRRPPGALEGYIAARLNKASQSQFVDAIPLHAVIRLCETAGANVLFGPDVDLKNLSDSDRLAAGGRGYTEIADGPTAIADMLFRLKERGGNRDRQDSASAVLAPIYKLLQTTMNDPGFESAREVFAAFTRKHFAMAAGQTLFGRALPRRLLHSIHSLACETGIHPKRLRKHLQAAGVIGPSHADKSDNNVVFDAVLGEKAAKQISQSLTLAEAGEHIGAARSQMDVLVRNGLIKPVHPRDGDGARARYAVSGLDAFLDALRARAVVDDHRARNLANIPEAARLACCSAAEVVKSILDNRLPAVLRPAAGHGYMTIHVDPIKLSAAVRGPEHNGVSLREAASILETTDRVVNALIKNEHLTAIQVKNPVNRCPQTVVAPAELKRFQTSYVSLHTLAKEHKLHIATMKTRLDEAGVKPAFDTEKIGARFYLRRKRFKV